MTLTTRGIVGRDGHVPSYDPDGIWRTWALHDIYLGTAGLNKHVPKVNDYVINTDTAEQYRVTAIDTLTLIPTLQPVIVKTTSSDFTTNEILYGVGPGTQSDTYRVYLDTTVLPFALAVDARLKVAGTQTSHCKLFFGTDTSASGLVVSRMYDTQGRFTSNNIPLEVIAIDSHENHAIKAVRPCYTTTSMVDGEIITAVFYSETGHVVSKRQLLVENTSFIQPLNVSTRYINHIALVSPFLSGNTLLCPVNLPINAFNIKAKVMYSDGTENTYPVDGTKFSLLGLQRYSTGIVGQQYDVVLRYQLSENERAVDVTTPHDSLTKPYVFKTIDPNYGYAAKLYCYPNWNAATNGYDLIWHMTTLDRKAFHDVTGKVELQTATGAYNPKLYGHVQQKTVGLDLSKVSPLFKPYQHVQTVDVTLMGPPSITANWAVNHAPDMNQPAFGGLVAKIKSLNSSEFSLSNGLATEEAFLDAFYYKTFPLYDPTKESKPPKPTHMRIVASDVDITVPVSDWSRLFVAGQPLVAGRLITLYFTKQTVTGTLCLSVATAVTVN